MLRKAWLCDAPDPATNADRELIAGLLEHRLHPEHRFEIALCPPLSPEARFASVASDIGVWVHGGGLAFLWLAGSQSVDHDLDGVIDGLGARVLGAEGVVLVVLDVHPTRAAGGPGLPDNLIVVGTSASEADRVDADGSRLTRAIAHGLEGDGQRGDGVVDLGSLRSALAAAPCLARPDGPGPWWINAAGRDALELNRVPPHAGPFLRTHVAASGLGLLWPWVQVHDGVLALPFGASVPAHPLGQRILTPIDDRPDGVSFDLVAAPASAGKSAILVQVALELASRADVRVLWLADTPGLGIEELLTHLATAPRTVLVLDQVDRHVTELHHLLRDLRRLPGERSGLHVLAAARAQRWQAVRGDAFGFRSVCDVFRQHDVEAPPGAASDALRLGPTVGDPPGAGDALLAIALVDALGVGGLDQRVLAQALDVSQAELAGPILDALFAQAPVTSAGVGAGTLLGTRHPSIARTILRSAAAQGRGARIEELARSLVGAAGRAERDRGGVEQEPLMRLVRAASYVDRALTPTLGAELSARIAIGMAEAAWSADPRVIHLADRVDLLRASGESDVACALVEHAWPSLPGLADHDQELRRLLVAWGHAEQRSGRPELSLALHLAALSDQAPARTPDAPLGALDLKGGLTSLLALAPDTRAGGLLAPLAVLGGLRSELPGVTGGAVAAWVPESPPPSADDVLAAIGQAATQVDHWPAELQGRQPLCFEQLRTRYQREIVSRYGPLMAHLPTDTTPDELEFAFLSACEEMELTPYPAQERGFEHVCHGRSVLLCTPTGSGKSLVALCAHFVALAKGEPSVYTAPTKALVNEKFFQLCGHFGSRNVGLITGDGAVNREAPILCCTAEIVANMALRQGAETPFSWVVMDEFHYLGDRARGMAWLVPLLELRGARFLMMSATIGSREDLRQRVEEQTGVETALVQTNKRPVPLEFTWRETPILDSIDAAEAQGITPAYVVCFSKRTAWDLAVLLAQRTGPTDGAGRVDRRKEIRALLDARQVRFAGASGKELRRGLTMGVAPHHGGMLPRYRRLVEQLVVEGYVSVVCGTDTLGVGVNMPIRSVIFTQLYKYDGSNSRHLQAREFLQIAGRAGRKGFDDVGHVWAQAPEHLMVNRIERAKAQAAGKLKKYRAKPPPREFRGWGEEHFEGIRGRRPGPLRVPFRVTAELVLSVLGRPDGDLAALQRLVHRAMLSDELTGRALADIDELIAQLQPEHLQRTDAGDVTRWTVVGAQDGRSMERPLGRFLGDALVHLDEADPEFPLRVLSLVECVLDDPRAILDAQSRAEKDLLYGALRRARRDSPEEEARLETAIAEFTHAQPEKDFIDACWARWLETNPWYRGGPPSPKSVLRSLFESGASFDEYVSEFGLVNEEGRLLYYLSDAFRVLTRELPAWVAEHARIAEIIEWLDVAVHTVDSSLVHEWERFEDPDAVQAVLESEPPPPPDITTRPAAFRRLVRNAAFRWMQDLSMQAMPSPSDVRPEQVRAAMTAYYAVHDRLYTGMDARGPQYFVFEGDTVRQTLADPADDRDWIAEGRVDWDASRAQGRAVLVLTFLGQVG